LTGDKIETAINIGFAAGLLDNTMVQYLIETNDGENLIKDILANTEHALDNIKNAKSIIQSALVIAGESLTESRVKSSTHKTFTLGN